MGLRKILENMVVATLVSATVTAPIVGIMGAFMAREANYENHSRLTQAIAAQECGYLEDCSVNIQNILFRENIYHVLTDKAGYDVYVEPDKSEFLPFWFFYESRIYRIIDVESHSF